MRKQLQLFTKTWSILSNRLRSVVIFAGLLASCVSFAQTNNCSFRLIVTDASGNRSCLSELPIGNVRIPSLGNLQVSEVALRSQNYHVAIPKAQSCDSIGVAMSFSNQPSRPELAIASCEAKGCACELAITGGTVVSPRLSEYNEALRRVLIPNVDRDIRTETQNQVSAFQSTKLPVSTEEASATGSAHKTQVGRGREVTDNLRNNSDEAHLAAAVRNAVEDERARQQAMIKQREAEAESTRQELERVKVQLAQVQQRLQAQAVSGVAEFSNNRRKALVIGNDTYTRVARLEAARADAGAIGRTLANLGFQVFTHTDLSERQLKQQLREFKSQVQPGDDVVFFFAGHGVQISGINYLLPTDIQGENEDQVRDEGVQVQRVLDDMQERGARFTLAVIDACRDNPFRQAGRAIGGRGLAPTTAASGQMIIFSAGAGQQALDRLGHNDRDPNGVFTRVFVKEMIKPDVPVDRVLRAVRNEVVQMARSVGKDQTPALYDQAVGDFFFKKERP